MRRTQHVEIRTKSGPDNGNSKGELRVIGMNRGRPAGPARGERGQNVGEDMGTGACWASWGGGFAFPSK